MHPTGFFFTLIFNHVALFPLKSETSITPKYIKLVNHNNINIFFVCSEEGETLIQSFMMLESMKPENEH